MSAEERRVRAIATVRALTEGDDAGAEALLGDIWEHVETLPTEVAADLSALLCDLASLCSHLADIAAPGEARELLAGIYGRAVKAYHLAEE